MRCCGLDLGAVISASHNPPEYNGVKLFDRDGRKLTDAAEEEIEALLDAPTRGGGEIDRVEVAADSYLEHVLERFGTDLTGLRIAVDCANGAYAGLAPQAFEQLGARGHGDRQRAGRDEHQRRLRRDRPRRCSPTPFARGGFDLGIAFDGDGDRMLAVDERGEPVDGDQILAVLALDLGVDGVAVTTMTNLGFHRLMEERGIRVVVTDVGDRYVLEALRREGLLLGGEQSGHLIWLDGHVTGDGLVAGLLLCRALARTRSLRRRRRHAALPAGDAEPAARRPRPAARARCSRPSKRSTRSSTAPAASSCGRRAPSRSSACSPRPRRRRMAERLSAKIAALVTRELG